MNKKYTEQLYIRALKTNGLDDPELISFLESMSFFQYPASVSTDKYYCYNGGLVDYLMDVCAFANNLNNSLPDNLKNTKESIVKVCLLHAIGKLGTLKNHTSDWHIKKGILYEYVNNITPMSISERSVYYITQKTKLSLTDDEFQAIVNYDKSSDDKLSEYHTNSLGLLLKTSIKYTILQHKNGK